MIVKDIVNFLEAWAPSNYQESYDNARLLTGSLDMKVTKAIVALDAIEEVVDEAIAKNANLIIAHHPIIFSGLKSLTGSNYVERTIIKAIKNDIAIYAIHTNLDNVATGVNDKIADKLALENREILSPKGEKYVKLAVFVPESKAERVRQALFSAGAGHLGNYTEASFNTLGEGTFKPNENANPAIGTAGGEREKVQEAKIEVIFPQNLTSEVLNAMHAAHPYEEVAYDLITLNNTLKDVGSGMIGELQNEMNTNDFLALLSNTFQCKVIRHTKLVKSSVNRIAVCGGAGSFLIEKAKSKGADIFITGDCKYHEFFDADNQIIIADIGHYESEQFTIDLIVEKLSEKFPNFAFLLTGVNTNSVEYFTN